MWHILFFLNNMLPYMAAALPVIIFWRILRVRSMKKRRRMWRTGMPHETGLVLFAVFMVGLFSQTIMPEIEIIEGGIKIIVNDGIKNVNLKPFEVISVTLIDLQKNHLTGSFFINFLGNILMFIPVGFFIPLLFRNVPLWKAVFFGLLISLFIEICQLPLDRWTDIDDLWLNALGAFLGGFASWIMHRLFPALCSRFKISGQG